MFAAIRHPDSGLRDELKDILAKWVESLKPRWSATQVLEALQRCKGTLLEPFVLDPDDQEISVMLVRVAFSEAYNKSRFRIVSRETIGNTGGCVLTDNLKNFYVERFAFGKHRGISEEFWSFAPGNVPDNVIENLGKESANTSKAQRVLSASVRVDDAGYRIELTGMNLAALAWPKTAQLSSHLQKYSVIGDGRDSLDALGLRVELRRGQLTLIPANPEATMRLTAHMFNESLLMLDPGFQCTGRLKIYLRVTLPKEGPTPLRTVVTLTNCYFDDWLKMDASETPGLSEANKLKIARWLMPHDSWIDSNFLEVV